MGIMSNVTNTDKTLGMRFLDAYNTLDKALRIQYNYKATISFTDLIRRCADLNRVVATYENELVSLARLRNAIIHSGDSTRLIAEPHLDVVLLIEKIVKMVTTPPLVIDVIKIRPVTLIDATRTMYDLIKETGKTGHGMIPAYKGNNLIGVVRWRKLIEDMGNGILDARSLDDFIQHTSIEEYLRTYPQNGHFTVVNAQVTIEQVLTIFNHNRKIAAVIITPDGTAMQKPVGILTNADIMDLMKIIENY